jgi:hypothetical protein
MMIHVVDVESLSGSLCGNLSDDCLIKLLSVEPPDHNPSTLSLFTIDHHLLNLKKLISYPFHQQ